MSTKRKQTDNNFAQRKKRTIDLPPDIWRQILARLPVKTLLTLKCVNKTLRSIIDEPDLTWMHLKKYNDGRHYDKTQLLCLHNKRHKEGWLYKGCTISLRRWDKLTETSRLIDSTDKVLSLTGSCLGLVLMLEHYPRRQLRLWNPSIRKSIVLPSCPFMSSYQLYVVYALGFSPSTLSFKVAAFQIDHSWYDRDEEPIVMQVAVYTVGDDDTQQWRIITNDSGVVNIPGNGHKPSKHQKGFLYFKGAVYWTVSDHIGPGIFNQDTHLISFDFDSEKFSWVELPDAVENQSIDVTFVFLMEEKLAIMRASEYAHYIWLMNKDDDFGSGVSWTLVLSDGSNETQDGNRLSYYRSHGCPEIFHVDDGGTTFTFENWSYNIEFREKTKLVEPSGNDNFKLHTYLESLALCKQGQPYP